MGEKTEGKYTEQMGLIRNLLYSFWFLSSPLFMKFYVGDLLACFNLLLRVFLHLFNFGG